MEDDETRSNTGDVTAAVFPTATATASKDDPLSSSHQSLLVQAGGDSNIGDSSAAAAAPTSSSDIHEESRKRPRNLPITNLLSRQVLSLVPNIQIPEKVNLLHEIANDKVA